MSTYNRVVAADSSASLAPTVRARLATEMVDPASTVGASLAGTFAPKLGTRLSRTITAMRAGRDQTWAVIGDSKTDPSTPGNTGGSWAERLAVLVEARFGVTITVTNVAQSGATAATQFTGGDITTAVESAPDVTFVSLGTNDTNSDANGIYAAGYVKEASIAATERAISYVRDANPSSEFVYLTTTPYSPITSTSNPKIVTYNKLAEELALAQGMEFVDGYATFKAVGDFSSLMYDSTHPGPTGNDLLAQELLKHFPLTGSFGLAPAIVAQSEYGWFGINKVDPDHGYFGYTQVSAVSSTGAVTLAIAGTGWAVSGSYDESSTVGDSITIAGDVTEFLVNLDLSLASSPVVDFYLDGVLQDADVDLHAQSDKDSSYYWLAPFTGLIGGAHTMKMVLKSGTLSVQAAVGVVAMPPAIFVPETTYLDLDSLGGPPVVTIDATGAYTKHLDSYAVSLPDGWNSALAQFVGLVQTQVLETTTTDRNFNVSLLLGSNTLAGAQFTHSATAGERSNAPIRVDSVIPIPVGTTAQGLTLQTRILSTDKSNCRLIDWSLKMILTRTG